VTSGKYDAKSGDNVVSSVWLKLIGIESEHQIIKSKERLTKRLSWRTILPFFFISEDDIDKETSIIKAKMPQDETALLSSILFLISGNDFSSIQSQDDAKKIRETKKKALIKYINDELHKLSERYAEIEKTLGAATFNMEDAVQSVVDTLMQIEEKITQEVARSKNLLGKIFSADGRRAECNMLLDRYAALKSQYESDIKRLGFIVDAEVKAADIPTLKKCPFCDGKMAAPVDKSYIEASRAELARIISQLDGLSEVEQSTIAELA
jgi:hypothetical protein